jgi:hypothetical protein
MAMAARPSRSKPDPGDLLTRTSQQRPEIGGNRREFHTPTSISCSAGSRPIQLAPVPQRYCDDLRSGITHTGTAKPPNPQVGGRAGAQRGEAPRQPCLLDHDTKIATESAKRNANTGLRSPPRFRPARRPVHGPTPRGGRSGRMALYRLSTCGDSYVVFGVGDISRQSICGDPSAASAIALLLAEGPL